MTKDLVIAESALLRVEPGVVVYLNAGVNINIEGGLIMQHYFLFCNDTFNILFLVVAFVILRYSNDSMNA